jgi:hypothetical protein
LVGEDTVKAYKFRARLLGPDAAAYRQHKEGLETAAAGPDRVQAISDYLEADASRSMMQEIEAHATSG